MREQYQAPGWPEFLDVMATQAWRRFFATLTWIYFLLIAAFSWSLPEEVRLQYLIPRLLFALALTTVMKRQKTANPLRQGFLLALAGGLLGNLHFIQLGGPNWLPELTQMALLLVGLLEFDYLGAFFLYLGSLTMGIAAMVASGTQASPLPVPLLISLYSLVLRHRGLHKRFLLLDQGRLLQGRLEVALSTVKHYNLELNRRVGDRARQLRDTTQTLEAAYGQLALSQEQKLELQRKWHQSQRLETLGRFAAGLYHEFSNGLTVIQGALHMAHEEVLDPQEYEILGGMTNAVERGVEISRRFLMTTGGMLGHPRQFDLNVLVREFLPLLPCAPLVDWIDAQEQVWVRADPLQMEQIVMNLALNAADASPAGERIRVAVKTEGDTAVVAVSDRGPGVPVALQERVFEPFFTTKAVGHGFGLGLAIVRQLAQANGGHCRVESNPDQGASFLVVLPRTSAPDGQEDLSLPVSSMSVAIRRGEVEARRLKSDAQGVEILLVEDEPTLLRLLDRYLRNLGYVVRSVASAEEALASGSEWRALITDIMLPGLGGLRLAELLLERQPDLRVVFISGYASEKLMLPIPPEHWLFLPKPFPLPAVEKALRQVLS